MRSWYATIFGVTIFCLFGLAAEEGSGSETHRWGITLKKGIEELHKNPVPGSAESAAPLQAGEQAQSPPSGEAAPVAVSVHQENIKTAVPAVRPEEEARVRTPPAAEPSALPAVHPSATAKETKAAAKPAAIVWASEQQKAQCESYLLDLRKYFLKARHYSIQGVPCDTAENAAAFLSLCEQSRKQCPPGLLEQAGYTTRILRNISYLETLGADRCGQSPIPEVVP